MNQAAYERMKDFINKGEVEQPSDFYGLLLHCYGLEDNEKTQNIFVKAMDFHNEKDGYEESLKMFNRLYPFLLSSEERQEKLKDIVGRNGTMEWNELKKEIKSIPQEEIARIEAVADGNSEKIKELGNKSPMELEAWEIDALQQIVLEQLETIKRYEKVLKGISLNEDNCSNHLWASEALKENEHNLNESERKSVSKILAHIEKNFDAPEVEEYLWNLLDNGTEFE